MMEMDRLTQQEGMEGTIVLGDIGAKAFEFLLKFIYTGSLESVIGLDCDAVTEILDACRKVKLWFIFIIDVKYLFYVEFCVCMRLISV
jgi:hypothetical protein